MSAVGSALGGGPRAMGRLWRLLGHRSGLARNVAVFAGLIVLGLAVGLWYILQEDTIFPWTSETSYYADFADAAAVAPGQHQEVRVAGVHVGDIGSAGVTRSGVAHIQLQITDRHLRIYQNASAVLQSKTPLNEMYVELDPGTPAAPILKPGGTIPLARTTSPVEIDSILQHLGPSQQVALQELLDQSQPALAGASGYLPSDLTALDSTLKNLEPVASALQTRKAEIATLVTDLQQVAGAVGGNQSQLAGLLNSAQSTLQTLQSNDSSLAAAIHDLPGTTSAVGSSLGKVQTLTTQLDPALQQLENSSSVLPGAIDRLNSTLTDLHPVLDQLGPLVKDAIPLAGNLGSYLQKANPTLAGLRTISPDLAPLTAYVQYDMPWLKGFFYNTDSVLSVYHGDTPLVRSLVVGGSASLAGVLQNYGITLPPSLSGDLGGTSGGSGK